MQYDYSSSDGEPLSIIIDITKLFTFIRSSKRCLDPKYIMEMIWVIYVPTGKENHENRYSVPFICNLNQVICMLCISKLKIYL